MEHVIGGVLLVLVGCFLGLVTYKKYSFSGTSLTPDCSGGGWEILQNQVCFML